jgi:hypothetical protein
MAHVHEIGQAIGDEEITACSRTLHIALFAKRQPELIQIFSPLSISEIRFVVGPANVRKNSPRHDSRGQYRPTLSELMNAII